MADKVFFLKIEGITPARMKLDVLGEYMVEFARMLGADQCPRFYRIKKSSTSIGARVLPEREVDARNRIFLVRNGEGPQEARTAHETMSTNLARDHAKGASVIDPQGSEIIVIPVATVQAPLSSIPALTKAGSIQGQVIRIGGKQEIVPVQIEDVDGFVYACFAHREIAKKLGRHIFGKTVRVHGVGKWRRDERGTWQIDDFQISTVDDELDDSPLSTAIESLRTIDSAWKELEDPHANLDIIRNGGNGE
jgi:hypothetical protein